MRPIKFRAWDGKKMSQPFFLHELEGYTGECNAVVHNEGDGDDWYQWTIAENGMPSKDTVILQYTGLKDKKGKEIYEGDIIRLEEWVDNPNIFKIHPNLFRVDWSDSNAGFEMYSPDEMWGKLPNGQNRINDNDIDIFHNFADNGDDYEIIGNIYENPELVK